MIVRVGAWELLMPRNAVLNPKELAHAEALLRKLGEIKNNEGETK